MERLSANKKKNKKKENVVPPRFIKHKRKTKESKLSKVKRFFVVLKLLIHDVFYGFIFHYFKKVNQKARVKLAVWCMKYETLEHCELLIKVFKWMVLPTSVLYVCADYYLFRNNALDSMFLGILISFYSNFLPDIPSIFRIRKNSKTKFFLNIRVTNEDLPWYKKYALLLFAPIFIAALFCGIRLKWKTTETFHNFKSLITYSVFLFIPSLLVFGHFPISIADITEILSIPLYAVAGYLTHLKVDKIW